jgi:antitoxin VapB
MPTDTKENITKPFMNGRSQAIRIPSEFRFNMDDELYINKIGNTLVVTPKKALKSSFEKSLSMFSDDFMEDGRPEESTNKKRLEEIHL